IGMTSLLLETGLDSEQRDFVSTIRTSGEALLTIINDILDFSKIESGKMELERVPFDLGMCIEEALDLFAMQASAKKLELAYHLDETVPAWITGDSTRLRQVLVNLVNNAVKFTPSGHITICVRRLPRVDAPASPHRLLLEFTVADTGIGIPSERLDRLFRPFSQVDSSTTRKYGGTGLGLAICQRLTHLMGGGIRVESDVGEGSRFIFTIQTESARVGTGSGFGLAPTTLQGNYVLGVEDNEVVQRRFTTFFRSWGVAYEPAASAAAATELMQVRAPALVLFDHDLLKTLGGPAFVARVDQLQLPTLFMLPPGHSSPHAAAQRPHVVPLNKPIKTATLVRCIHTALKSGAPDGAARPASSSPRVLADEIPLDVLLVEDNAVNQKVALRFLDRLGYRADAVGNGIEALTAIENRHFDLVFMDLQMPEMDGLEASRRIRQRLPSPRQPKIVALTANALQGDRELCLAAGMDDYITKPVKLHDLDEVIRRQFRNDDSPSDTTAGAPPLEHRA
ncbi:MAG TPA: response regulator, partial [Candidatus Synoicihabitans sp.]|nr:response regulator [Candidatus Synoicihabitans sp.]